MMILKSFVKSVLRNKMLKIFIFMRAFSRRVTSCVPISFIWEKVIPDLHGGVFSRHRERGKTLATMEERFYWSLMRCDVARYVQ